MVQFSVSNLISGTIETAQANRASVLLFIGGLTALGTVLEVGLSPGMIDFAPLSNLPPSLNTLFGVGAGLGGLLVLVQSVLAHFLLWRAMLQNGDLLDLAGQGHRILPYVGLTILTTLGTMLGFLMLIIPGLLASTRWLAAPAFLLQRDAGVIESMGNSWRLIKGNSTPIIVTYFLASLVAVVLSLFVGIGTVTSASMGLGSVLTTLFAQIVSNTFTMLQVALGVYVFRQLTGATDDIGAVFE
jgi:hypothetical protein